MAKEIVIQDVIGNPCPINFDMFAPRHAEAGDRIDYTIVLQNLSGCTFTRLNLVDILPDDVRFEDAHPWPSFTNSRDRNRDEVLWENLLLVPGETRHIRVNVRVDRQSRHDLINEACVRNQHLGPWEFCTRAKTRIRDRE
jgi:uncharacterized repeat protein (TIGR01451 family)